MPEFTVAGRVLEEEGLGGRCLEVVGAAVFGGCGADGGGEAGFDCEGALGRVCWCWRAPFELVYFVRRGPLSAQRKGSIPS